MSSPAASVPLRTRASSRAWWAARVATIWPYQNSDACITSMTSVRVDTITRACSGGAAVVAAGAGPQHGSVTPSLRAGQPPRTPTWVATYAATAPTSTSAAVTKPAWMRASWDTPLSSRG